MNGELLKTLSKRVMPGWVDAAWQIGALVVLIVLYQGLLPDTPPPNVLGGLLTGGFAFLWVFQNYLLGRMVRQRADRLQKPPEMSERGYKELIRASMPNALDAAMQAVLLLYCIGVYQNSAADYFPSNMIDYAWTAILVPLWLVQHRIVRFLLHERIRNAYYREMYRRDVAKA